MRLNSVPTVGALPSNGDNIQAHQNYMHPPGSDSTGLNLSLSGWRLGPRHTQYSSLSSQFPYPNHFLPTSLPSDIFPFLCLFAHHSHRLYQLIDLSVCIVVNRCFLLMVALVFIAIHLKMCWSCWCYDRCRCRIVWYDDQKGHSNPIRRDTPMSLWC